MGSRRARNLIFKGVSLIITLSIFTQSATPLLAMPQPRPSGASNPSVTESNASEPAPPAVVVPASTLPTGHKPTKTAKPLTAPAVQAVNLDELTLLPGWNLLATPKEPPTTDPSAVFAPIAGDTNVVYAYDGCQPAAPWQVFDPAAPPTSNDLTAVTHQIGFWIQTTVTTTLPLAGTIPPTSTIELCEGWNLIGLPMEQARPVRNALYSIEGKYTLVFGYDPADTADPWQIYDTAAPDWANDLEVMLPGRGYWVLATEDTTLTIANVGEPPIAEITSPAETTTSLTSVTFITDIIGTAYSNLLEQWTLSYRPRDEDTWTSFATGVTPVMDDVIDQFDPTLLLNGPYEIELEVSDYSGQVISVAIDVIVEGDAKIGNFSLSYADVSVPVVGLPVQAIRTYDSRDKRQGDFGVGWSLDFSEVRIRENVVPGDQWRGTATEDDFPVYCVLAQRAHIITITFPDQVIYKFRTTVTPSCQLLVPQRAVQISYDPLPGTEATLRALDFGTRMVVVGSYPGPIQLWDEATATIYDPARYELTLPDGRIFIISEADGLQTLEDEFGNTLTVTPDGITHSSGRGILFERDEQNRIIQITDPLSRTIRYEYDERGDLVSVIDQRNLTTTYTYDDNHYLLTIQDARGVQPVRNEFDENGRLIHQIDATGRILTFTHQLDDRREIVINRLGHTLIYEYDSEGNVIRETDGLGGVKNFQYDSFGNWTSSRDPLGRETEYEHNELSNLTWVEDPLGNTHTYSYTVQNDLLGATDRMGQTTTFSYDNRGALASVTDPSGGITTYTKDSRGNTLSESDPLGCTYHYEYDTFGNVTTETNPLGYARLFTYDANSNRLSETVTRTLTSGVVATLVTTYEYNEQNQLVKTTYPDGSTTATTYNEIGLAEVEYDELGRPTHFEYDAEGRLVRVLYPDSTTELRSYDAEGRLSSMIDRGGHETRYVMDAANRLVQLIRNSNTPNPIVTSMVYDAAGQLLAQTDERGNTSYFAYNALGHTTMITNALGITQTFTYDTLGHLLTVTDGNNQTTTYEYDPSGRRIATIFSDGTQETVAYNLAGEVTARTDQAGKTTRFAYNCLGQLIQVTDALSQTTTFTYDEVGNRIAQTDANGHTTRFIFDDLGRVTSRILPLGQVETMAYDPVGNLISSTDFENNAILYSYNENNQLLTKEYPDGSTITVTYTSAGQRESVTDNRGTTTYSYDARGFLAGVTTPDNQTVTYAYDASGNRTSITGPAGVTTYQYDALNRLQTVTDPADGVTTYTYDPAGNRASLTHPNGVVTSYHYNSLNRLTEIQTHNANGTLLADYDYILGPAGNRLQVNELGGRSVSYSYDDAYRLTAEIISVPATATLTIAYSYDPAGNRLSKVENGVTTSYSYDANDRLLSDGQFTYLYDDNGNLITQNGSAGQQGAYSYDYDGRLTQASYADGFTTTTAQYVYDADGNQVQNITNGLATNYLVDSNRPLAQVLLETDTAGVIQTSYVYGDELLSRQQGSLLSYYHTDGQMSTRQLSNAAQNVTDNYTFDAFGNLLAHSGATPNVYLYTGERYDDAIDSYYLRARYYQPATGRFLTPDPFLGNIFEPASLHQYTYAHNNPVNLSDPTGLAALVLEETYKTKIDMQIKTTSLIHATGVLILASMAAVKQCAIRAAVTAVFGPYAIAMSEQMRGSECRARMNILYVDSAIMPTTAFHTANAQLASHPTVLTRKRPPAHSRGWLYQKGQGCQPEKPWGSVLELLFSCDEYPFASAVEGGEKNKPSLMWVPWVEQTFTTPGGQGRLINRFYQQCGLNPGTDKVRNPAQYTFGVVVWFRPKQPFLCR